MVMHINKGTAVPVPDESGKYLADALYFIQDSTDGYLKIYLTDTNGDSISHVATHKENVSSACLRQDTPPPFPCASPFWLDTEHLVLCAQYDDGTTTQWVEITPSFALPEFAGTGVANTMARSDHNHNETYVTIGLMEW